MSQFPSSILGAPVSQDRQEELRRQRQQRQRQFLRATNGQGLPPGLLPGQRVDESVRDFQGRRQAIANQKLGEQFTQRNALAARKAGRILGGGGRSPVPPQLLAFGQLEAKPLSSDLTSQRIADQNSQIQTRGVAFRDRGTGAQSFAQAADIPATLPARVRGMNSVSGANEADAFRTRELVPSEILQNQGNARLMGEQASELSSTRDARLEGLTLQNEGTDLQNRAMERVLPMAGQAFLPPGLVPIAPPALDPKTQAEIDKLAAETSAIRDRLPPAVQIRADGLLQQMRSQYDPEAVASLNQQLSQMLAPYTGTGAAPAPASGGETAITATGPNGEKIVWNPQSQSWLDARTSQPIQ